VNPSQKICLGVTPTKLGKRNANTFVKEDWKRQKGKFGKASLKPPNFQWLTFLRIFCTWNIVSFHLKLFKNLLKKFRQNINSLHYLFNWFPHYLQIQIHLCDHWNAIEIVDGVIYIAWVSIASCLRIWNFIFILNTPHRHKELKFSVFKIDLTILVIVFMDKICLYRI